MVKSTGGQRLAGLGFTWSDFDASARPRSVEELSNISRWSLGTLQNDAQLQLEDGDLKGGVENVWL